eukprot:6129897-Prymnesium_polylepis.1
MRSRPACRLIVCSRDSFRNLKFQNVARNFEICQPASHSRRHSQPAANDSQRVARAQRELLDQGGPRASLPRPRAGVGPLPHLRR